MKRIILICFLLMSVFTNIFAYKQRYINPQLVTGITIMEDNISDEYHISVDTVNKTYSISLDIDAIDKKDLKEFKSFLNDSLYQFKDLRRIVIDYDNESITIKTSMDEQVLEEKHK